MCGISGIISNKSIETDVLKRMNHAISHRGPDDEGFFCFSEQKIKSNWIGNDSQSNPQSTNLHIDKCESNDIKIGLGHRRLSILDLSVAGHQPMSDVNERYYITFNGEVYNYIEIKAELEALGLKFKTNTDTEVIINAYATWGAECLNKMKGMWAFCIFDSKTSEVFMARDRFGIKPLYYYFDENNTLYFGSEIKQFTVIPSWKGIINKARVYDFLAYSFADHTNQTLFKHVFQIEPGNYFLSDINKIENFKGELQTTKWYDLRKVKRNEKISFTDSTKKFKELFYSSCKAHLRADVPIGSCLSGGLDSSAIVCTVNELLKNTVDAPVQKTFTACAIDEKLNEKKWADIVNEERNLDAHYTYPDLAELMNGLEKLVYFQDEPFQSSSIFMQYKVFELASKSKIKVMLDGQGADEQLCGYLGFIPLKLKGNITQFKFLAFIEEIFAIKKLFGTPLKVSIQQTLTYLIPHGLKRFFQNKISWFYKTETESWLNKNLLGNDLLHPYETLKIKSNSVLEESLNQMGNSNLQKLLHWEDRNSMAFSIEARVPFLDHDFVEFNISLPDDAKIHNGITKRVMREALIDELPNQIKNRKDKIGFMPPEEKYMRDNPDFVKGLIKDAIKNSKGIIGDNVEVLFNNMLNNNRTFDYTFWRIIIFGAWMKKFNLTVD